MIKPIKFERKQPKFEEEIRRTERDDEQETKMSEFQMKDKIKRCKFE